MRLEWSIPAGAAVLCGAAFLSGFYPLFGVAVGLAADFLDAVLLQGYTRRAVKKSLPAALQLYAGNLMLRMAVLAAAVGIVAKTEPRWTVGTCVGIAAGVVLSIVFAAKRFLAAEEGGEKHA